MKSFIVNSKDLFDERKNPGLKLSVESIIKNKNIKKIPFDRFMKENYKYVCKKHGHIYGHKNREVILIGGNKPLP